MEIARLRKQRDDYAWAAGRYISQLVEEYKMREALLTHLEEASEWVCCECGERGNPSSSKWRWNGDQWEHHHEYPIGHVLAEHKPEPIPTATSGSPPPRSVLEIVRAHLKQNGFDGLSNEDGECACIFSDLAPCGEMSQKCRAGYRRLCDCGDHDYHIGDNHDVLDDPARTPTPEAP